MGYVVRHFRREYTLFQSGAHLLCGKTAYTAIIDRIWQFKMQTGSRRKSNCESYEKEIWIPFEMITPENVADYKGKY